jgi:hypothetical protein
MQGTRNEVADEGRTPGRTDPRDGAPRPNKRLKPDKRGWIWLAPVRLWLGLTRDRLGGLIRLTCSTQALGSATESILQAVR